MKEGDKFSIDSYNVDQYDGIRVVDTVLVKVEPKKYAKKVLVYLPTLMASHFVFRNQLKPIK